MCCRSLEAAVNAAEGSVANTPSLLSVLRETGVVDAGGQGLYTLLKGTLLYLKGEAGQSPPIASTATFIVLYSHFCFPNNYGFTILVCTEYVTVN